ncbi:unnamed protein product, partial [Rotaria sordida]
MKLVLPFLVIVAVLVSGADGTRAHADMFLAGTNDFIGTIDFYEDPTPWGVFITGSVNRLRPLATLASWTFSASGHGKGPCDGLGAVIKSTATQYLLKGGPYVSFSTAKQFFEWCLQKNDRMVVARPRRTDISNVASNHMPEPNRPIEIRWLPSNIVKNEFEELLKPRWDRFSSK